ncbi:hypothetical protein RI129_007153 [Pyrocoelia pectoralis]|uniref:Uncharacterized protein n=1 Tax=Pyrocoelia pectoralis TaxID=417401 RepID=A0AAN7VDJ4_9COLE
MSTITPQNKLSGSGDGIEFTIQHETETPFSTASKTPMRFGKTKPVTQKRMTNQVQQIKKIRELATNPNITKRRSLTLSEITLSKSKNTTKNRQLLSTVHSPKKTPPKKNAGHKIYQLLLLNAWRQQKNKTCQLSGTLKTLETQNSQLVLQIDALNQLRASENEKRNEAVAEISSLQIEISQRIDENNILKEDTAALNENIRTSQEGFTYTHLQTENVKNNLMTSLHDILDTKCELGIEHKRSKTLLAETELLTSQIKSMRSEMEKLRAEVQHLQKKLADKELKLKIASDLTDNNESETAELMGEINAEVTKAKILEETNAKLKADLAAVKDALGIEAQRGAWRNVQDLGLIFVDFTKIVLVTMLPALPSNVFDKK